MHLNDYFTIILVHKNKLLYTKMLESVPHEQYKTAMLHVVELVRKHELESWLIDSTATSLTLQDQRWAIEELGELLNGNTSKQIALVHSNDLFMEMAAENIRYNFYEKFGLVKDLQHFSTIEEALHWLSPTLTPEKLFQYAST